MSIDSKIDRARAALLALGDLACFMDKNSTPAEEFGYGLSVLLGYVMKDLEEAKSELCQYMKDVRQENTGGGTV
jgi:hypothetical protein